MATVTKMPSGNQPERGSPEWLLDTICETSEPTTQWVDLTPELAEALLNINPDNRSFRKVKVTQYSADMASGRWALNGEPIIVSKDGYLNDGQHRCLAVIDANATIPVAITFGIERETRLTVDQGGARSAGDFLGMEGVNNAALVAAIARMAMAYEASGGKNIAGAHAITATQVRERAHADPALGVSATFGHTNSRYTRTFAAGSIVGLCHYILSRKDAEDAEGFLSRLCKGDDLKLRDPAHTVREKLISMGKTSRERKIKLILQAWTFHRRKMKVAPASMNSELPFPAII